ncbi:ribose transport system ATP-binding protein [Halanaerobium saccharolyticum]|uniref:Ribose transport system ATP-binding protein n=1 Tax=Halanaerobium saccharolyticum TaxID=43595 RepID=A0A4R7Z8B4_9FIRM|nr:ATP-binding cassette domain-containing protein [Halanaerobium saccharolyticum]RAK07852.1 ribose transport system ATP-binding protein [Halanaerobium saccharolyticum]TDW04466.1 ribose transport system ATP-binding protein [Halanaerobium saccharolyticum]TDX59802.1 ribose transport system ATP-binding protein [Halanaerobium saccharolyticum]
MSESFFEIINLNTPKQKNSKLNNFNLELKRGEVHAVIGLEGSGKKNLTKALAGLIDVKGTLYLNSKMLENKISFLRDNGIDFLFNSSSLVEQLTIEDNICLNNYPKLKILPFINKIKARRKAEKIISFMDLDLKLKKTVSNLSKDEKKQLSLAKILYNKPKVVIMHEPTDGLSVESIKKFYDKIYEYKSTGGSIIYITKQWKDALKIADRISVIYMGSIIGTISKSEANLNQNKILNLMLGNYDNEKDNSFLEDETQKILNTVFKATEFLTSNYELKDVLKLLAEYSSDFTKADNCIIKLIDENTKTFIDTFKYEKESGLESEIKKEKLFAITKDEKIFFSTIDDSEFNDIFVKKSRDVKSVIIIPVLIRSQVSGVIQLSFSYKKSYNYSKKESIYLNTLAKQAAIAIEDTRLMGRSTLLQESHHRIKNNLQYIISLISLQKDFINKNPKNTDEILTNIICRIKSIAAVHDLLSKDSLGRSIINLHDIFDVIIKFLNSSKIEFKVKIDDIFISYAKASAIALVFNEILSNCIEHAFQNKDTGIIEISSYKKNNEIKLIVKDNGKGIEKDFKIEEQDSLGLSIVYSIIKQQFKGEISLKRNIKGPGTIVEITIPE